MENEKLSQYITERSWNNKRVNVLVESWSFLREMLKQLAYDLKAKIENAYIVLEP
jgi:hypothetical protein